MNQDNDKLKRKNLIVGWIIGICAVALYVGAIYYNVGTR
jgi:hypothetical protein